MTKHNLLTNSELHEQKDISTANDMEVYFSDGAGSGDWKPLLATAGSWDYSTDVDTIEFTDLGDFGLIQIDLVGITLSTNTNQHILCQVGNNSGYTTSSVYYNNYWGSDVDDTETLAGLPLGFFRNNSPDNTMINGSQILISNFNRSRYTVATSQECFDESTTTVNAFLNRTHWIRETKSYNKIRLITSGSGEFTGGSIVITGFRYEV